MRKIFNVHVVFVMMMTIFFVIPVIGQNNENGLKNSKKQEVINENKVEPGVFSKDASVVDESKKDEAKIEVVKSLKKTSTGKSLFDTVSQGGPMMIVLFLLGLGGMTIALERVIFFTRNKVWADDYTEEFLKKTASESDAKYKEDLDEEMRGVFQLYSNSSERGLALLSGIGNLAPIVGFLGTVIGMISAFASIAAATTVNAKVVAVGIQIALVTTAGGLFVAAPTLMFYFLFTHVLHNRFTAAEVIISEECDKLPRLTDILTSDEK